ncbi:MAG: phosphoenolpyruvate carboxylase [Candidatus Berkiella sp.]
MEELDRDAPLRKDVRLLGELLGETLKEQVGIELYDKVEKIRVLSKEVYDGDDNAMVALNALLSQLAPQEMLGVVRAFSHFLNLANIAENVHRIRRTKWYQQHLQSSIQPGSLEAVFVTLHQQNIPPAQMFDAIMKLKIELVLTAHPTEVMRRTIMQKFDTIAKLISQPELDDRAKQGIFAELTAIWQTDEIRRKRPTPIDEAKWGFAVVETSLWSALPNYLRDLDEHLVKWTGQRLPLTATPIRFSSWMGGDRDGNPNVTAKITEEVCLLARWVAADLYEKEISHLSAVLSMHQCNEKLQSLVGNEHEPYRAFLRPLKRKLARTKQFLEESLANRPTAAIEVILDKTEILEPLMICYDSLQECHGAAIADGELTDLIRRVSAFGISLLPLDIRECAAKHTELLNEITQLLGLGAYAQWSEQERQQFLLTTLEKDQRLIYINLSLSDSALATWDTFKMISRQLQGQLGAYVISMVHQPSDILAVCLLQREAGIKVPLRVVPLYETREALLNAAEHLNMLLMHPWYKQYISGNLEVMIGYSDSGKDAGIIAAGWAQYQAQEQLVAMAAAHDIQLTLFHGRGGSIGRGGAPAHTAILSLPPGAVNGSLRVTEQGEVIRNKYGLPQRARRSLEIYTTATLEAMQIPLAKPHKKWRNVMAKLSETSFTSYTEVVKENKAFIPYFEAVTPLREIGSLMMGSRPARRQTDSRDIDHLRAIPWIFAWTQNRLLLPTWLGVGEALGQALEEDQASLLQEMAHQWPFFGTLVSMIEMVLVKTDLSIATLYEKRLAPDQAAMGRALREKFLLTVKCLKESLDTQTLLLNNPTLLRTIMLRSPYLYPLHVLQAELLWRVRTQKLTPEQADLLRDALMVSISGIAAGMQNTG